MNLFDFIRNTFVKNEPVWNYYGTNVYTDPIAAPEQSAQFIREYFIQGGKGDAYELDEYDNMIVHSRFRASKNFDEFEICGDAPLHLSQYRAIHTVSAFFLGIFLEDCLTQKDHGVDIFMRETIFSFSYLWFLTCLYHDYGYIVEENWKPDFGQLRETKVCEKDGYYRLRKIEQRLSILHSPYQQVSPILRKRVRGHNGFYGRQYKTTIIDYLLGNNPSLKDGLQFACGAKITGFRYSQSLLMKYFSYGIRRLQPPTYNHGVIGGYLLFDRFLKIYASAYRHRFLEHDERYTHIEAFDWGGRNFCIEQIPILAHIADCIISHNVWKADASAEAEYLECGLGALVGERFKKISFQDNPLLFILAIVDTIEPYKLYGSQVSEQNAIQIWKSFDVSFADNALTVSARYKCRPITKIYERAQGLKSWWTLKMLCSAAPEKVSALNLKRLKADNKTCGQSQTRRDTHLCVSSFLELHFCYAKVVACGRAAERARAAACTPSPPPTARACRAASASRPLWSLRRSSDYIGSYIRERETAVRSPVFVIAAGRP